MVAGWKVLRLAGVPVVTLNFYLGCYKGPTRENLSSEFANNTGADQPAHPRRLISAFVIRFLERTIFNLATGKISIF